MIKNGAIGRPQKLSYGIMARLTNALEHGATISEACAYAGISRDTYYRYLKSEEVFAVKMANAKKSQYKLMTSFFTRV